MKINLITNIEDLRIKHFEIYEHLKIEEETIGKQIKVISCYTGISIEELSQVKAKDLNKLYRRILDVLSKYVPKELPLSITIQGQEFELVQEFKKLPAGWYIDADNNNVNLEGSPELLPAFCYIEKGMDYAEKDKHKSIINPLQPRAELFKEHFPLTTFIDLTGFFLHKWELLKKYLEAREEVRARKTKELIGED